MTPRFIMIVVGPCERTQHWLPDIDLDFYPNPHIFYVNQPEDVLQLQGICIDKRVKDEAFIDLTEGDPAWRETLAYVDGLFS